MNYLKVITAVFIGVLTLMSSRSVEAQVNSTSVTVELCRIGHVAQNNQSIADRFRIILSVRETHGDREIYSTTVSLEPGASIVTKKIPNNRIEDLDIDADAELIIRVESVQPGSLTSLAATGISRPSEQHNVGRLNADRMFDVTLNLSRNNRNSDIRIRGKVRI